MASQQAREWMGIQQFPGATQSALYGLLSKLKQEDVNSLTILVMGKGGVGKSSTVNSLVGERVAVVSAFQAEAMRPVLCSRSRAGFTLNIIDTPGLIEGGFVNDHALDLIKRFLTNKIIDVLLYVDRLDSYRVDNLDKQIIKAISDTFGKQIWQRSLVVFTHAQLSPPDGLSYADFVERRSAALHDAILEAAGFKKSDIQMKLMQMKPLLSNIPLISNSCKKGATFVSNLPLISNVQRNIVTLSGKIPVVLVENSGRCNTNDGGEKILPDGTVWLPNLVKNIVEVATNDGKSIVIDKKLIDGPDANQRGKRWIPAVLLFQYFFVMKRMLRAIKQDKIAEWRGNDWVKY
ncbi:translocase of chloroplast 34, chloroplastic [Cryptomeria japonica]|uniref:translocase of chloroplast 34, chloroplastic n=1 Tax=Cryptomeria japonica TaxID=3369 RepID=UPI0027DAA381|nr:translocase of chloroplast 34, chloroplastic [Cryptomeria japonica]